MGWNPTEVMCMRRLVLWLVLGLILFSQGMVAPAYSQSAAPEGAIETGTPSGADDDRTRAGALLRGSGAQEECSGDHDAELHTDGARHRLVGSGWVQPGLQFRASLYRRGGFH